jgi:putative hydrolase of the HAD superfamily
MPHPDMVILFDVDGTLIDHDQAETVVVAALHRRLGHPGPVGDFYDQWRNALERHYARYLAGELSIQEQPRARLREVVDPTLSDLDANRLISTYLDDYLVACRLYPDVEPTLAQLTAYRLGIILNSELTQQRTKLARNGIAHHFGVMIMSADCGIAKPAPGIFHLACDTMDVLPSQAVYVGDRPDIDADAARKAGLRGIWLDRTAAADGDDHRVRIRSLLALPAALALFERDAA